MNKAFIIIIQDRELSDKNLNVLHDAIKADKNILGWWHHLTSTYIIITPSHITAPDIRTFIQSLFPNVKFMALQIKYNDYDGWLPDKAWDWMEDTLGGV